jgi:hypothetical protein
MGSALVLHLARILCEKLPGLIMEPIVLKNVSERGEELEATFLPDKGMNMISYKKGAIEIIDQSTKDIFEERYAGLGALIGPHFHHRNPGIIPAIKDESLFPHIARLRAKGVQEPFSHGIGRYAPWQITQKSETMVSAKLTGKDNWNGVPLAALEGQNFTMTLDAELIPSGLQLHVSVVSDTDSVVGIHYYYHLPQGKGTVSSRIQKKYIENQEVKEPPQAWFKDISQTMQLDVNSQAADFTFFPFPNTLEGNILLDTGTYKLLTTYMCRSQENCWQLYHPAHASFVCIEPLSAQDPRHPNLTASSLQIKLAIMDN